MDCRARTTRSSALSSDTWRIIRRISRWIEYKSSPVHRSRTICGWRGFVVAHVFDFRRGPLGPPPPCAGATAPAAGALAGPPLTALGAYGASESFYQGNPNANYGVALKGAYLGVGIGLATHVALCALTKNPFVRDLSLSLATGFAGGMSSWAIHNAGTLVR